MIPQNLSLPTSRTVSHLIDPTTKAWDFSLIDSIFLLSDAQAIKAIPLFSLPQKDHMYWPLKIHGCYSVKSRYQMLHKGDEASIPIPDATQQFWKGIWRLQVPGKIKHFMWKACRNALPTKVNLVRQKILEVNTCQNCDRCPESITHALWECESI